ncbi:hypothetical protein KSS87_015869 [Heliosperma pusillum]|nr:hypothetical protein KSS87_015869 [Heliosperma pusillum]
MKAKGDDNIDETGGRREDSGEVTGVRGIGGGEMAKGERTRALRSKMKAKALKECDVLTAKYAECASGRTLSVVWKCREQAKELNNCLHQLSYVSVVGRSL